jgi:hypothetical protein
MIPFIELRKMYEQDRNASLLAYPCQLSQACNSENPEWKVKEDREKERKVPAML